MEDILENLKNKLLNLEKAHGKIEKWVDFGWILIKFENGTFYKLTLNTNNDKVTLDKIYNIWD